MAIKPIQILINAKDNASGVFSSLQAKIAAVGASIASYFTVRSFFGAVQGAAELEAKLAEVQAVSGATAGELVALRAAAEAAGASTKFTATEAADALGNLARSGLDANSAIAALPSTLALAQSGSLGLAESSSIMTRALAGFGLEAAQAGRVADVLAKGANSANTTVTGLGQALSFAAPTAVSLGLSLEDTVAIIGKFADAGIDAGRAGTALNAILAQFSDPASKFRKELAAAGITTGNFGQALSQLGAVGPTGQKAILAVGQEAGPALRALLNQGIGSLDELRAALLGAEGAAAATAATMDNNLQGASRGLASAWDTVKNALATPVLPVLQQGVTQLAEALRSAVSDGTVGRFGEALARGFQSALEAFKAFIAQVDFQAIGVRIEEFVASAGRSFETLTEYATNAGNSVKLSYGVMAGGVNAVKAAILGIGSVFAEVASIVMEGVARLRAGLASVTFGSLSAGFKEAAEDARISAGAFGASAQAMRDAAEQALVDVADNAVMTREAWVGLTSEVDRTAQSASTAGAALADVASKTDAVAKAAQAATTAQQQKAQADQAAAQALAKLRQEYAGLIASGDLQAAALKLNEINAALGKTPGAAVAASSAAKATAEEVNAAFERMGVVTKEALAAASANAKRDFDIIKSSGQATADGLQVAFRKYAEAAIAANGGVATDALKAQAAMQKMVIVTDGAGKAIVRSMAEAAASTGAVGDAASQAGDGFRTMADEAKKAKKEVEDLGRGVKRSGGGFTNAEGFSSDARGNAITTSGYSVQSITQDLMREGLDEEEARRQAQHLIGIYQAEFRQALGARGATTGRVGRGGILQGGFATQLELAKESAAAGRDGGAIGTTQTRNINLNLSLGGTSYGAVSTDAAGADVIQRLMDDLGRGKRTAS